MRLVLVDGMSIAYRAFYAFQDRPLRNAEGFNTSVLFGFLMALLDVVDEQKPTHVGIAWDSPEPTLRQAELSAYKANRQPPPDELLLSLPPLRELLKALRLHQAEVPGYEADDLIATWTQGACQVDSLEVVWILSADKDLAQLVRDKVLLYRPARGRAPAEKLDPEGIEKKFGVKPQQIPDFLALVGDSSDNLPGVRGIGEKTAVELLTKYGSLEEIYKKLPLLPKALHQKLLTGQAKAWATYQLALLGQQEVSGAPFVPSLFAIRPPDWPALIPLLRRYALRKVEERLRARWGYTEEPSSSGTPPQPSAKPDYQLLEAPEALEAFLNRYAAQPAMGFDVETTETHPISAQLVGLALCPEAGKAIYVPISPETWPAFRHVLTRWAQSPTPKVAHNLKYDWVVLANHGLRLAPPFFDTLLADYLLDAERPHNLSDTAQRFLGLSKVLTYKGLFDGLSTKDIREVPLERLVPYACQDADLALRLYEPLRQKLAAEHLTNLYEEVELPLLQILAQMELTGIYVDSSQLNTLETTWQKELAKLTQQAHALAGKPFNLNSPQQVAQILYMELGLPIPRKTPTGQPATDEEALKSLASQHPLPEILLRYRELAKLCSTYIEGLRSSINPKTGRVHTIFQQAVAATGRLSSQSPNLQNIPIRTERGRQLRKAFAAQQPDHLLLSADYSQIELRIMAALSGDPQMIDDFRNGRDIHEATAQRLFGASEITPEMRRIAKTVNFGIIYGITAHGLAERLGNISRTEAQKLIDQYFARYPRVQAFIQAQIEEVRQKGYAETLLGRRRYIPNIQAANKTIRAEAERLAMNTPIQGTAADLIKLAMISLHRNLPSDVRLLLQIHDELLWEIAEERLPEVVPLIWHLMTSALKLPHDVPIEVDIQVGPNWLEMQEIPVSSTTSS